MKKWKKYLEYFYLYGESYETVSKTLNPLINDTRKIF